MSLLRFTDQAQNIRRYSEQPQSLTKRPNASMHRDQTMREGTIPKGSPRHLFCVMWVTSDYPWLSLGQAISILTFPPVIFMFPWSNFIPMQIRRRGERGANPIVGSPLLMYSLHLVHVGERASVATPPVWPTQPYLTTWQVVAMHKIWVCV